MHSALGSGRSLYPLDEITGPAAEPGDDPDEPGQGGAAVQFFSASVRPSRLVFRLLGPACRLDRLRPGDLLSGAAVAGQRTSCIERTAAAISAGELGEAAGFHLRVLKATRQAMRRHSRTEDLFDDPYSRCQVTIWRASATEVTACVVSNRQCTGSWPSGGSISCTSTTDSATLSGNPLAAPWAPVSSGVAASMPNRSATVACRSARCTRWHADRGRSAPPIRRRAPTAQLAAHQDAILRRTAQQMY